MGLSLSPHLLATDKTSAASLPSTSTRCDLKAENPYLVLVNKEHPLEEKDLPTETSLKTPNVPQHITARDVGISTAMQPPAAEALEQMVKAAKKEGIPILISNAFHLPLPRFESKLYQSALDAQQRAYFSNEHCTGLAVDLNIEEGSFEESKAYKWLKENASKFGFIERYTEANRAKTGHDPEPWHFRFVGNQEVAEAVKAAGSLEVYLEQLQ
jgi:D-alanyl-D-alanine carboxypeptidase